MSRSTDGATARPLPRGLRTCPDCGEIRGTTTRGSVSACYCSGLVCNRCGGRERRPITDFYDPHDRRWWHVPYFNLMAHRCKLRPGEPPHGEGWTTLEPDPDVLVYQEAATRLALSVLEEGDVLDVVKGDQRIGFIPVGRPD